MEEESFSRPNYRVHPHPSPWLLIRFILEIFRSMQLNGLNIWNHEVFFTTSLQEWLLWSCPKWFVNEKQNYPELPLFPWVGLKSLTQKTSPLLIFLRVQRPETNHQSPITTTFVLFTNHTYNCTYCTFLPNCSRLIQGQDHDRAQNEHFCCVHWSYWLGWVNTISQDKVSSTFPWHIMRHMNQNCHPIHS